MDFGNWKILIRFLEGEEDGVPGPSRAFGDEVITGDDELVDAENAFIFEGGDNTRTCDSLHRSFERFVKLLRQNHLLSLSSMIVENPRWRWSLVDF